MSPDPTDTVKAKALLLRMEEESQVSGTLSYNQGVASVVAGSVAFWAATWSTPGAADTFNEFLRFLSLAAIAYAGLSGIVSMGNFYIYLKLDRRSKQLKKALKTQIATEPKKEQP